MNWIRHGDGVTPAVVEMLLVWTLEDRNGTTKEGCGLLGFDRVGQGGYQSKWPLVSAGLPPPPQDQRAHIQKVRLSLLQFQREGPPPLFQWARLLLQWAHKWRCQSGYSEDKALRQSELFFIMKNLMPDFGISWFPWPFFSFQFLLFGRGMSPCPYVITAFWKQITCLISQIHH